MIFAQLPGIQNRYLILFSICFLSQLLFAENRYLVRGFITDAPDGTIFTLKRQEDQKVINKATVSNCRFSMVGQTSNYPELYQLYTTLNGKHYSCELFLNNDSVRIEGNLSSFPDQLTFEGAKSCIDYHVYNVNLNPIKSDSTSKISYQMDFIRKNIHLVIGQFVLFQIMKQLPIDSLKQIYQEIPLSMRQDKYVRYIRKQIYPSVENYIRKAEELTKMNNGMIKKYTFDVLDLLSEAVRIDPEYIDLHLTIATQYIALIPRLGLEAYDKAIEHMKNYLAGCIDEQAKEMGQNRLNEIEYRRSLLLIKMPEMIHVKGGTFIMGSTFKDDDNPPHQATVGDFYISKHEVTNHQFALFLKEYNSYTVKSGIYAGEPMLYECNWGIENGFPVKGYESHPAIYITWFGAQAFCEWADGRLPSEEEWEYAARGGMYGNTTDFYSGSLQLDSVGWYDANSKGSPHQVGTLKPNELGLYDMSGNVWEWCSNNFYADINGIKEPHKSANNNHYAAVRGGAWFNHRSICRTTCRYYIFSNSKHFNNGFRLVRDSK